MRGTSEYSPLDILKKPPTTITMIFLDFIGSIYSVQQISLFLFFAEKHQPEDSRFKKIQIINCGNFEIKRKYFEQRSNLIGCWKDVWVNLMDDQKRYYLESIGICGKSGWSWIKR